MKKSERLQEAINLLQFEPEELEAISYWTRLENYFKALEILRDLKSELADSESDR